MQAVEMRRHLFGEKDQSVAEYALWAGRNFLKLEKYESAIDILNLALNATLNSIGEMTGMAGEVYNLLGFGSEALDQFTQAIYFYEKALGIQKKLSGERSKPVARTFTNLGIAYDNNKEYEKALEYHERALDILRGIHPEGHKDTRYSITNIGVILEKLGRREEALLYFFKNLEIVEGVVPIIPRDLSWAHYNIAITFFGLKRFDEAIHHATKGLDALNFSREWIWERFSFPDQVMNLLGLEAHSLMGLYDQSNDKKYLLAARQYYDDAIIVSEQYANDLSPAMAVTHHRLSRTVYEYAVRNDMAMFQETLDPLYLAEAFFRIERSKSRALLSEMSEAQTLRNTMASDSSSAALFQIRQEILKRQSKIESLSQKGVAPDEAVMLAHKDTLMLLRAEYESLRLQKPIEPGYFNPHREGNKLAMLQTFVRDVLEPDQTFIQYLVGEEHLYIFLIDKDTLLLKKLEKDEFVTLNENIQNLLDGIQGNQRGDLHFSSVTEADKMVLAAHELYQMLVAPIYSNLKERIVISTDHILGYLPFDVFLLERPKVSTRFDSHLWLGNEKMMSYVFSAEVLRNMVLTRRVDTYEMPILSMAPFSEEKDTVHIESPGSLAVRSGENNPDQLSWLPGSKKEVDIIHRLFGGKVFQGRKADLEAFYSNASKSRILHLSTHAAAGASLGGFGWLAFADSKHSGQFEKLYIRDIYRIYTPVEMITLSACQSGVGKTQHGEALVSLARAFTKSGAHSLITTLWPVSDESTSEMMIGFYGYMKQGYTKDRSLWQARKDFRKKHKGRIQSHPYFWSGLVAMGDMKSL